MKLCGGPNEASGRYDWIAAGAAEMQRFREQDMGVTAKYDTVPTFDGERLHTRTRA